MSFIPIFRHKDSTHTNMIESKSIDKSAAATTRFIIIPDNGNAIKN